MMTKTDYEVTAVALRTLPVGARVGVYTRLIRVYVKRSNDFDPWKFGESMGLPPLFRMTRKQITHNTTNQKR